MKYYFVGAASSHANVNLDRFGMSVDCTEEEAKHAIRGGAALLTEEEFKSCGFTESELKEYYTPGRQLGAPETFKAKRQKAWQIVSQKCTAHYTAPTAPVVNPIPFTAPAPVAAATEKPAEPTKAA